MRSSTGVRLCLLLGLVCGGCDDVTVDDADAPAAIGGNGGAPSATAGAAGSEQAGAGGEPAAAVGGSTAEPAATSGGANAAAPPTLDPGLPSYEVPVMDAALQPFARYAVGAVEWTAKKGERKLEYALPADLVGSEQRLELVGADNPNGPWTLRGATFGSADCQVQDGQIVCREALAGVAIDVNAVSARVQAGELPPQRLEITKVFNGDPIGILRFPAP